MAFHKMLNDAFARFKANRHKRRARHGKVLKKRGGLGNAPYKSKRPVKERAVSMTVPGQIVPTQAYVSMPYSVITPYNSSANTYFQWRNGLYDPYVGTGGHQPLGSDQWANFYYYYRVLKIKGTARIVNKSTTVPCLAYQWGSLDLTIPATPGTFENPGNGKPKILGVSGGGHDVITVNMTIDCTTLLSQDVEQYEADDRNAGTLTSADPSRGIFTTLYIQSLDNSATIDVVVLFDFVYECQLFGSKTLESS